VPSSLLPIMISNCSMPIRSQNWPVKGDPAREPCIGLMGSGITVERGWHGNCNAVCMHNGLL